MKQSNQSKGKSFETLVANMFNLFLDLTGFKRVKPMPRSGAFHGMKGDLINVPKWLPFTVECKDWDKLTIEQWWTQVDLEAQEMGTRPWLIFKMEDCTLSVKLLEDDLKLLSKLREGK